MMPGGAGNTRQLLQLAQSLLQQRRYDQSVGKFRAVLDIDPTCWAAYVGAAKAYAALNQHDGAIAHYEFSLRLRPNDVDVLQALGIEYLALKYFQDAAKRFERALTLEPSRSALHYGLGRCRLAQRQFPEAVQELEAALKGVPGNIDTMLCYGVVLSQLERHDDAMVQFDRVLAREPDNAVARFERGSIYLQSGRLEEARRECARAIELDPRNPSYLYMNLSLNPDSHDADLATFEDLAKDIKKMSKGDGARVHFALANHCLETERFEEAFAHFRNGHAIIRSVQGYDEPAEIGAMRKIAEAFTPEAVARTGGHPDATPIFVLGMPRSGSTLVEQVLASHPDVAGAGEVMYFADAAGCRYRRPPALPSDPAMLRDDDLRQIGAQYLNWLKSRAQAKRIVDKQLDNYLFVGLIRMVFPNAAIVHIRRDPLDTCFSCYTQLFLNGLDYANDLGELGRYYNAYEAMMVHWRTVLPPGAMLELRYEDLVTDFEMQVRRLLDYCGLAWNGRCLEFYKTDRPVRTSSTLQVRKPLYRNAIGRAASYSKWLEPLCRELNAQKE